MYTVLDNALPSRIFFAINIAQYNTHTYMHTYIMCFATEEEHAEGQFEDVQQADNLIHRYTVCHSMSSMDKVMTKTLRTVSSLGNIHPCSEAAGGDK